MLAGQLELMAFVCFFLLLALLPPDLDEVFGMASHSLPQLPHHTALVRFSESLPAFPHTPLHS